MKYRQPQLPPLASESVRRLLREALQSENYFIYDDGRRYLRERSFDPSAVVAELVGYIERDSRLYVLPGTVGKNIKYQCCLRFESVIVHAKISKGKDSDEEGWFVMLGFHDHNTGAPPLPE